MGRLLVLVVAAAVAAAGLGLAAAPPPSAAVSAQCLASQCFALFWEARSLAEAGAACAGGGGRLMRARSTVAAEAIELLRGGRPGGVWLGLRLPEGRCVAPGRALRGFEWVAGDERTDFEAWASAGPAEGACGPRCVVVSAALRWEERDCQAPADGFLCEFSYPRGSCAPLAPPPATDVHYTTPFGARDADLSAFPPGTTARLPGLDGATLVCQERANGSWGWAADAPGAWPCQLERGGCEGRCQEDERGRPFCTCPDGGAALGPDGRACLSPCARLRCQHHCAPLADGAVCLCQEGYQLDADGRSCADIEDCQARPGPCEQECINTDGGFHCRCFAGYTLVESRCTKNENLCFFASCQQGCVVTNGTFRCTCEDGFTPDPDDPRRCIRVCDRPECSAQCDPHTGDHCFCPDGYIIQEHDNGTKVCTDIDECEEGYCDGECRNLFGGYECLSTGPPLAGTSLVPDEGSGEVAIYSTPTPPVLTSVPPKGGRSPGTLVAIIVSTVLSFVVLAAVVYCFLTKLGPCRTKKDDKCWQLENEVGLEPVGPGSTSYKQKL